MKKLQQFLDLIFPHQYLIVDEWDEMDTEFDVYGIYEIPQHQRALGWEESKRVLKSYSPEFVILQSTGVWYGQYTVTYPGTREDPPDSYYVELKHRFNSAEDCLVGIVQHIIEKRAKFHFQND